MTDEESGIKFHGGRKGDAFQRNIAAIRTLKALEENLEKLQELLKAQIATEEQKELTLIFRGVILKSG